MAEINLPGGAFTPIENEATPAPASANSVSLPGGSFTPIDLEAEQNAKFGSPGQQALQAAEAFGQGYAGPVATGIESALSAAGVPGLTPEEREGRAKANPGTNILFQTAGFGAGAFTGTGEARLLGKLGTAAVEASGLGKGASVISKIAASGIRGGAELAALQTGDEVSKAINQDPNQTLGSAAINIGLSGIIGGAGGAALGSVSPLFKTAANKLGISKFASDLMGETKFLQDNPEIVQGAKDELASRVAETEYLKEAIPGLGKQPGNPLLEVEGGGLKIPGLDKALEGVSKAEKGLPEASLGSTREYVSATQKLADTVAKAHIDNGLEIPLEAQLNPTPALNRVAGLKSSIGQKVAQWGYTKGADYISEKLGKFAASAVGGVGGALLGHPVVGAYTAEKTLSPVFSNLIKPFVEKAIDPEAMRASVDYLANALKGDELLGKGVKNFFSTGEILPKFLLPDAESRGKLVKSLAAQENPQNAIQAGGKIGHYLPDHGMATGALVGAATSYLAGLKPKSPPLNPFDATPPVSKSAQNDYDRQLDIAQQPLMVLQHAKNGTLMPQDIKTLNTLYPGLHASMVKKINDALIDHKSAGKQLPYTDRMALSSITGSVLDSTMASVNMQAIIRSAGGAESTVQSGKQPRKQGSTGAQLRTIEKAQDLYLTRSQRREAGQKM